MLAIRLWWTDPGGVGIGGWGLHRRCRCVAGWRILAGTGLLGQGAVHAGDLPEEFSWGHVRQLDRVSRELLARAWAAGAGPGDDPLTIDLDSTVCETYGLAKEGAQRHNYAGQRGYHPLFAIAAGTGDMLMSRLRKGRANTARGAAHFLRETVSRMRRAGATGPLTVRADSGFYNHDIVAACRDKGVRYSITVRQHQSLRNLIEAIPESDWVPISYWMEGAADVAETQYTPFQSEPDAVPVRLILRRVKSTPGSQLALFTNYSYHAFITDRDGETLDLEADPVFQQIRATPRSRMPSATSSTVWASTISPRDVSPPTVPGWRSRSSPTTWPAGPHASGWANRCPPSRPCDDASSPRPDASPARPVASPCIFPRTGPGRTNSPTPWRDCAPCPYLPDRAARLAAVPSTNRLAEPRQVSPSVSLTATYTLVSPVADASAARNPLRVADTLTTIAQPRHTGVRDPVRWIWG